MKFNLVDKFKTRNVVSVDNLYYQLALLIIVYSSLRGKYVWAWYCL